MGRKLDGVRVVLLDIEGTTTPISFVKDKLFGYVRNNLLKYLNDKFDEEELRKDIADILNEAGQVDGGLDFTLKDKIIKSVVSVVLSLMDQDKKSTALKQLQGHMFLEAFQSKAVVAELFPDVLPSMRALKGRGLRVAIYSSGSIFAQKLLFGHTEEGDITEFLSGFFDTTSGAKVESSSYIKISQQLGVKTNEILFLTDLPKEASAAAEAGCEVCLVVREGNLPISDEDLKRFETITSFSEVIAVQ